MKVLVACEFSGVVRDAFLAAGHDAWSCDLLPSERSAERHFEADALEVVRRFSWDLLIAHPPCTALAVSGARWFPAKRKSGEQAAALRFVRALLEAPVARIALENPVSIISTRIRPPSQVIQPWMFGHAETKSTCLWLKGLPPLASTKIVSRREARVHREAPGPDRWKNRSRTLPGIAAAMAHQWGSPVPFIPEPQPREPVISRRKP